MIFLIFFSNLFIILSLYHYDPIYVLKEYLNKQKEDEKQLKDILKHLSETFNESYAYNEIAKNPPQPYFDKNYHKKVDIQKSLKEIKTTNISFYEFYQQINRKISELKDLHIDIQFGNNKSQILNDIYSICPIKFLIRNINGTNKIYCKLNKYHQYFDKNIIDIVKENQNQSIVSINNQNPFDFISNFCDNISSTKNPHGTFTHKFNNHYGYNLKVYPVDKKDLNLEIIYENNKKLNFKYIFVSTYEISDLIKTNNENLDKKNDNNNMMFNEYLKQRKIEEKTKKLSKLIKEFNELNNISENKNNNKIMNIQWDYSYGNKSKNIFKCRVDKQNKVNVYYIRNFCPENITLYKDLFYKCVNLFDQNKYPIIIILNNNDGGQAHLPKIMIELISPLVSVSKFISKKVNSFMKNNKNLFDIDNIIEVDYGENNKGYLTKPIEDLIWLNEELINYKRKLKNKRKPTDILIYTDGYSFSAASNFIKYFQYYGGGIVTGFFGNPSKNYIPFDSGQSSSSIMDNETLYSISPTSYKYLYDKYNITLKIPGYQCFFDDLNLNVPLEYLVTEVDEKIEIYENFKDNNYNIFIEEAKKIFDKYKTKCNPKNKKLVYVTDKCNGKFGNEYTYGGYECGDNGLWSNKCIPSYCDIEYVFNHKLGKCIPITKENKRFIKIIILIILIIILIMIIFNLIMMKYNKEEDDDSEEELIDMSEENKN